jgi:tryptophan-rich sensory protein
VLLAPRQLQRVAELTALLDSLGLRWVARSRFGSEAPAVDVVLLDTLGELHGLMALGDVAFIGGTFDVSIGGHSPVEALAAGLLVVHGPAVWASAAAFERDRCRVATDEATLIEALRWGLTTPRLGLPAGDAGVGAAAAVAAAVLTALPAAPPPEEPLRPWLWPFGAAWSAITAWYAADAPWERSRVLCLFSTNAVCHLLWSPLFFRAQRPDWALVEVVFLWVSLVLLVVLIAPISSFASLLIMPYLLWVSFAAWLNWAIVRLNRPFA